MEKNANQVYVINPNYVLRRDEGVATISEACCLCNEILHRESTFSHVHLLTAQLLSCFDGKRSLVESVNLASELLGVDTKECFRAASLYIENEDVISNRINGSWQAVPENMLVLAKNVSSYKSYDPTLFIAEAYDFSPPKGSQNR